MSETIPVHGLLLRWQREKRVEVLVQKSKVNGKWFVVFSEKFGRKLYHKKFVEEMKDAVEDMEGPECSYKAGPVKNRELL